MATLTIWIPDSLVAFVDAKVAIEGFGDKGEYLITLLRDAQTKGDEEEALNEELLMQEGVVLSEQVNTKVERAEKKVKSYGFADANQVERPHSDR